MSYLDTIRSYYPTAYYADQLFEQLIVYLRNIGFNPNEVMAACSVCSDGLSAMQFPIADSGLLGPFYLGGLDGFPFTGLTGVQAFAHHMPEDGALLIYYGPHIGITEQGAIGKVHRSGQDDDSDCCGAAQAALNRIGDIPQQPSLLDYQQDTIVGLFQARRLRITSARYPIQEATEVMFEAINERLHLLIEHSKKALKIKTLILVGTIFINVDDGSEACVSPRTFRTVNLQTDEVDDHEEKFEQHLAAN